MTAYRIYWLSLLVFASGWLTAAQAQGEPPAFAVLLSKHCASCHDALAPQAGLDLTRRARALAGGDGGPVIVPGKPDESLLLSRVADGSMPPERDGRALTRDEVAALRAWIAAGAVWPEELVLSPFDYTTERRAGRDWWSLQPLARPVPPALPAPVAPDFPSPVDAFVRRALAQAGLSPSPPADRRTLLRRATLDLIGLPPSYEEITEFQEDRAPDAYERRLDRLLASPHYGERWGRHWLDVARYGESDGFEHDKYREHAWPYRDYVIGAFNQDRPLADFIREQVAGDVLPQPTRASLAATGFLVAGPWDEVQNVGGGPAEKRRAQEEQQEELIGAVSQAFLGMTINCARCHHHKFDPIPLDDYYRLRALLGGVDHGNRPWQSPEEAQRLAALRAPLEAEQEQLRQRQAALAPRLPSDAQVGAGGDRTLVGGKFGQTFKPGLVVTAAGQLGWRTRPLTVECWAKLDSAMGFNILVASEPKSSADHWELYTYAGSGELSLYAPGFTPAEIKSGVNVCNGQWRHLGVSLSETEVLLYVDGKQVHRRKVERSKQARDAPGPLAFGSIPGTGLSCAGLVDEVRIRRGVQAFTAAPSEPLTADDQTLGLWAFDALVGNQFPSAAKSGDPGDLAQARAELERLAAEQKRLSAALAQLAPPLAYLGVRKPVPETIAYLRGDVSKPGPVIAPALPEFVRFPFTAQEGAFPVAASLAAAGEGTRRLALAEWLAHRENPLPARVLANRIWQHHFGRGLVETPSDLGFQGGQPANALLLDYLAAELRASGSVKRLHRLVLQAHAYQQTSRPPPELRERGHARDADNRLTWRFAPRRLEAETVRDLLLATSGELNRQLGGPSFKPFTVTVFNTHFYHLFDRDEPEYNRRTVYRACVTTGKSPLLAALDCPAPSLAAPKRQETVTPLQALGLMNDSFVQRQAERLAAALNREAQSPAPPQAPGAESPAVETAQRLAQAAFRRTLGRDPTPAEQVAAVALVREHGLRELCWTLLNSSEFLYLP